MRKRRYYKIPLQQNEEETLIEILFTSLYKSKDILLTSKVCCVENNFDLPILEKISFIFSDIDIT